MLRGEPRHETAVLALRNDPGLWDTIMLKYGFLNQWAAKEVFPLAIEQGVGVLNMAAVRISLTRPQRTREVVARWKEDGLIAPDDLPDDGPFDWLLGEDVDSVISAGYKFGADHPAVSTVITGTSSIEHLEANARSLEKPALPARTPRSSRPAVRGFGRAGLIRVSPMFRRQPGIRAILPIEEPDGGFETRRYDSKRRGHRYEIALVVAHYARWGIGAVERTLDLGNCPVPVGAKRIGIRLS